MNKLAELDFVFVCICLVSHPVFKSLLGDSWWRPSSFNLFISFFFSSFFLFLFFLNLQHTGLPLQQKPKAAQHCCLVWNKYHSLYAPFSIHGGIDPSLLHMDASRAGYHIFRYSSVLFTASTVVSWVLFQSTYVDWMMFVTQPSTESSPNQYLQHPWGSFL